MFIFGKDELGVRDRNCELKKGVLLKIKFLSANHARSSEKGGRTHEIGRQKSMTSQLQYPPERPVCHCEVGLLAPLVHRLTLLTVPSSSLATIPKENKVRVV